MTTQILYRKNNPTAVSSTVYVNRGLTVNEFDGNFKSIQDQKLDIEDLKNIFDDIKKEKEIK